MVIIKRNNWCQVRNYFQKTVFASFCVLLFGSFDRTVLSNLRVNLCKYVRQALSVKSYNSCPSTTFFLYETVSSWALSKPHVCTVNALILCKWYILASFIRARKRFSTKKACISKQAVARNSLFALSLDSKIREKKNQ